MLRPLALGKQGADADEDLQGAGLRACWPHHLSASELFRSINKPRERVTSRYSLFLGYDLVGGLKDNDLPVALQWVRSHAKLGTLDERRLLIGRIMERAALALSNPRVRKPFIQALLQQLDDHAYSTDNKAAALNKIFDTDTTLRRKCIDSALTPFREPAHDAVLITRWGIRLAQPDDLRWLLQKLKRERGRSKRERISQVIARVFCPDNLTHIHAVIEAANSCAELYTALAHWLKPIELQSQQAVKERDYWKQEQEWKRRDAQRSAPKPPLEPSPADEIRTLLDQAESGDFEQWWRISHWAESLPDGTYAEKRYHVDLRTLPGWQNATDTDKRRMVRAAFQYL
jgi:hypothetical protein